MKESIGAAFPMRIAQPMQIQESFWISSVIILENEELRARIARHGYNTVTGKFSMENMLQRIVTS